MCKNTQYPQSELRLRCINTLVSSLIAIISSHQHHRLVHLHSAIYIARHDTLQKWRPLSCPGCRCCQYNVPVVSSLTGQSSLATFLPLDGADSPEGGGISDSAMRSRVRWVQNIHFVWMWTQTQSCMWTSTWTILFAMSCKTQWMWL